MRLKQAACRVLLALATAAIPACQSNTTPEPGADVVVTVSGSSVIREIEPGLIFGANFGAWISNAKLGTST
jgi:hypothetical protein